MVYTPVVKRFLEVGFETGGVALVNNTRPAIRYTDEGGLEVGEVVEGGKFCGRISFPYQLAEGVNRTDALIAEAATFGSFSEHFALYHGDKVIAEGKPCH